jgi:hypothetical protein
MVLHGVATALGLAVLGLATSTAFAVDNTTTCTGANCSATLNVTSSPRPTTTRAPPTPVPPPPMTECERGRFVCDDTMWRCVRGAGLNAARCTCLAEYWDCLVNKACGPRETDAAVCADRASGLLCPDVDDDTGLRVCPEDAGVAYDESGGGWIAAVVFFCLAVLWFLVTLAYIAVIRGWIRRPSGALIIPGDPPVETSIRRFIEARRQRNRNKEQGKVSETADLNRRDNGVPGAVGEPPELVLLSPEAMDRYRDYLRLKYREARARGEEVDEPALLRSESAKQVSGKHPTTVLESLQSPKPHTAYDTRAETELHGYRLRDEHDELAQKALEIDAVDREIDAYRARIASSLERARTSLVREISVGREAAAQRLPSEFIATSEGLVRRDGVTTTVEGAENPYGYRDDLAGGRFRNLGHHSGADRHGGFTAGQAPAAGARFGVAEQAGANPISLLFAQPSASSSRLESRTPAAGHAYDDDDDDSNDGSASHSPHRFKAGAVVPPRAIVRRFEFEDSRSPKNSPPPPPPPLPAGVQSWAAVGHRALSGDPSSSSVPFATSNTRTPMVRGGGEPPRSPPEDFSPPTSHPLYAFRHSVADSRSP